MAETKYDLNNTYINEYTYFQELFIKGSNRTSSGSLSFTSSTSSQTYNSITGEVGMLSLLQTLLLPYMITSYDFNLLYQDMDTTLTNTRKIVSDSLGAMALGGLY